MPKEKDSFWEYVEDRQGQEWKCNFCDEVFHGKVIRIKAHLAGVKGHGIRACNNVNSEVRSKAEKALEAQEALKAQKALKAKGPVESRKGPEGNALGSSHTRFISSSITQGPHQPVTVSDEDACRETPFTAMPNTSNAVGIGSSASTPLHETNVQSQSLPAQNMISQRDFSSYTQHPQSQVGDSIPQWNSSCPSGSGDHASEALIKMPGPVNAEDGEPNTEVPQEVRTDGALMDSRPSSCGLVDQNTPTLKRKLEELSNREADMDELEEWCRKAEKIKGEYWSMVQAYREGRSLAPQQIERVDDFSKEVEDILGYCSFRKESATHAAGCRKSDPLRYRRERSIIIKSCHSVATRVDGEIGGGGQILLPKNVEVLEVGQCGGLTSLCQVGPLENLKELKIEEWDRLEKLGAVDFPHLKALKIIRCSQLKHLFEEMRELPCLLWFDIQDSEELEGINIAASSLLEIFVDKCPKMKRVVEWEWLATRLPNLKSIKIKDCEKLEEIISGPVLSGGTCLMMLKIYKCNSVRVLLTHDMLPHLPVLQTIVVEECKGMEVIIGHVPNMTHVSVPSLSGLTLHNLPELKSICDGTVSCVSIQQIKIFKCSKLKRISLQLPQLDNGFLTLPRSLQWIRMDQQTWDSLQGDPTSLQLSQFIL